MEFEWDEAKAASNLKKHEDALIMRSDTPWCYDARYDMPDYFSKESQP